MLVPIAVRLYPRDFHIEGISDNDCMRQIKQFFDAADYLLYRLLMLLGAILILWKTLTL